MHLLFGAAVALVVWRLWPETEAARAQTAAATYHHVPLSGDGLWWTSWDHDAANGIPVAALAGGCVPFVEPLIAHPRWSLQITAGVSGCSGDTILGSFEVAWDGAVAWKAPDMPERRLTLTSAELAVIEHMNEIDCVRGPTQEYSVSWVRVSPGGVTNTRDGAVVTTPTTQLGVVLDGVMAAAIGRYRAERLAAIGPFEVHLTTGRYRINMDGKGHVSVRHGRRELIARDLDEEERVEVFDFLSRSADPPIAGEDDVLRGELVAAGVRVPVSRWRYYPPRPLWALWRVFEDALYVESNR